MGDAFEIVYDALVVREDLLGLDRSVLLNIKRTIEDKLLTNPEYYGKPLRGALHGYWSLRVGEYRIAYHFASNVVHVDVIKHRSVIYETLRSRI